MKPDNRKGLGNGFVPINLNFGGSGNGNGSGMNKIMYIIAIIFIVIVYFSRGGEIDVEQTNNSENGYSDPTDISNLIGGSNSSSTADLLNLFFGTGTSSTLNSNQDYVAFEDTSIKNTSQEKYTLMVYMCGSNLESDGGYASSDLEEMLKSTIADEMNVLIYTGGAKRWFDFGISNKTNQIYTIKNHKLVLVKDNLGLENMGNPNTLAGFLKFAKENYPAKKYGLIMWDHGGGAVAGFGMDQNGKANDALTIDEIKTALNSFGQKLEFVGFDACLMANVETAYALKDNANYMIASEETEPGTGWDYLKILNTLSKNTSQDGAVLGKTIVDSFIASNSSYRNPDATLSVVDLSKMNNVYSKLVAFMKEIKTTNFDKNKYNSFSRTVATSKAFGEGSLDSIDLIDFASKMNVKSSSDLINAVKAAVSYNKTNQYVENSNGLSIFIPYKKISYYNKMTSIYKNIGMGSDYTNVLNQYVNALANGKKPSYQVNNNTYNVQVEDYSSASWFDLLFRSNNSAMYEQTKIDTDKFEVEDKGDYYALSLSKEDWQLITKIESVLWYDDGKGYIDMGSDSLYDLDEEGDLKVTSNGEWISINGDNVHYEVIERTDNYEKGKVPAVINGERVNIILYFDKEVPDGIILGYEPDYEEINQELFERGLRNIHKGDKIDFVAPYYNHDGSFKDEYYINDTLIVGDDGLKVNYDYLGDGEIKLYYKLTDIYNNDYYTEPVILE